MDKVLPDHKYKYTRRAPDRYRIDPQLLYLEGHIMATTKRKCMLHPKEPVSYQVRCTCKWRDTTYVSYASINLIFNRHIKEASKQLQFDILTHDPRVSHDPWGTTDGEEPF